MPCIQIVFSWTSTERKEQLAGKVQKTIKQFYFLYKADTGAAKRLSKHDCSQLLMEARTDAHAPTAKQRVAP